MNEYDLRKDMIEVGRRCWVRNWVAANDGNFSVRLPDGAFLATASGVSKGFLSPADIVKVDPAGRLLDGDRPPSSELAMHLLIYQRRPEVGAVVHAHPPYATAHAVAGLAMDQCVLPEIVVTLGTIPLADYGTPSTPEVPGSLLPFVDRHDAVLLRNHGALAVGTDLFQAYFRMETIEHAARILHLARGLGAVQALAPEQVERLMGIRARYGLGGSVPACQAGSGVPQAESMSGDAAPPSPAPAPDGELVERVTDRVMRLLQSGLPPRAGGPGPGGAGSP